MVWGLGFIGNWGGRFGFFGVFTLVARCLFMPRSRRLWFGGLIDSCDVVAFLCEVVGGLWGGADSFWLLSRACLVGVVVVLGGIGGTGGLIVAR